MYVRAKVIAEKYGVSRQTLQRWSNNGKIKFITTPTGGKLYDIGIFEQNSGSEKETVLYARESSAHQEEALCRQIELLQSRHPNCECISEIGSGLNLKRKGLCSLLERVMSGNVSKVVVASRDRLARFGVELIEWLFEKNNVKLVVLCPEDNSDSDADELRDDLLAVFPFFAAKNNGRRAGQLKRSGSTQNKAKASKQAKTNVEEVNGYLSLDFESSADCNQRRDLQNL